MNRISALLELLEETPDDVFLLYALGLEYSKSGDQEKALEFWENLVGNHPDYLPTYYMFAQFLSKIGDHQKAYKIVQTGIELSKKFKDSKTKSELESLQDEIEEMLI